MKPIYIQLLPNPVRVDHTDELVLGSVMIDLDESGKVIGIEILDYAELRIDGEKDVDFWSIEP